MRLDWRLVVIILIALCMTTFSATTKKGLLVNEGDIQIYYCYVSHNCQQEFAYVYPTILLSYPLSVFGFSTYVCAMVFIFFFVPSFFLYVKTGNPIFSLSWMFIDITFLIVDHALAQGIIVIITMFLLLFDSGWRLGKIPTAILYMLSLAGHRMSVVIISFLALVDSGLVGKVLRDKRMTAILMWAMIALFFAAVKESPGVFRDVEQNPSSLYLLWVSLPLIVLSIHGQETELKNTALLAYALLFASAIIVSRLQFGEFDWIPYYNFMRINAMADMFALAFIARGKHNQNLLAYVAVFLAISCFYRYALNPFG